MKGPYAPHLLENQLRYFKCLAVFVPGLLALSIALLLWRTAQLHEVLLRAFEGPPARDILGLVVFTLLCLLLGTWDHHLTTSWKDREYPRHANPYLDELLRKVILGKALIIVALPFLGLIFGLIAAWQLQSTSSLETVRNLLSDPSLGSFTGATLIHTTVERYSIIMGIALGLMILALVVIAIVHYKGLPLRPALTVVNIALGLAAVVAAWGAPHFLSAVASLLGAFSVMSLITMSILAIIFGFIFVAQRGVPLLAGLLGLAAVVAASSFSSTGTRSPSEMAAGQAPPQPLQHPVAPQPSATQTTELHRVFDTWLKARGIDQGPVFVFALPGGGIYAASAAATLLATLQDRCPGFARHVFAISAVSGGAVGSSVFNSILAARPPPQQRGCAKLEAPERTLHVDLVKQVIQADHLAPVGAFILPDLLRKVPGLLGISSLSGFDRAQALELSLERAMSDLQVGGNKLPAVAAASKPFTDYWTPASHLPALVLNTTWVETGNRVAFAPFPLNRVGDGTLYSFKDDFFKDNKDVKEASVLKAGVVSARFPGTSPAWQLSGLQIPQRLRGTNVTKLEARTWNFVDGGYADNSGTQTAYDIYAELRRYIAERKLPIELRLIALSEEDLDHLPDGTRYTDTVAPISALLNVRKRGLIEVVRKFANEDPELNNNPDAHVSARSGSRSRLLVLRLDQEHFPLTLGWTISEYRNSTIRLQLGAPELCHAGAFSKDQAKDTILGNSCIQREIFTLLGMK